MLWIYYHGECRKRKKMFLCATKSRRQDGECGFVCTWDLIIKSFFMPLNTSSSNADITPVIIIHDCAVGWIKSPQRFSSRLYTPFEILSHNTIRHRISIEMENWISLLHPPRYFIFPPSTMTTTLAWLLLFLDEKLGEATRRRAINYTLVPYSTAKAPRWERKEPAESNAKSIK